MKRLKKYIDKYRDMILYLIFGFLTTVVNFSVYFPLYNYADLTVVVSNVIAWIAAVSFAFITNKLFVFQSKRFSFDIILPELLKFIGCRAASLFIECLCLYITVDLLHWSGNIWKLLISILVVVLNYIGSKLLVFKKSP